MYQDLKLLYQYNEDKTFPLFFLKTFAPLPEIKP